MGLISSLNRSEEAATPSCPLALTTTGEPVTAVPLIPAIKALLWVPCVPTRVVLDKGALTRRPALFMPMVLLLSVCKPSAVLFLPMVLFESALKPLAVLLLPVVLLKSVARPFAVLLLPVVLLKSASKPAAVLSLPVVLLKSA